MSRQYHQPNSKIILLLFSLLFVILMLGTWVSSILVQERQDLRNQAFIADSTNQYCNQACSTHSDCASNYICFNAQCRFASNPSNVYCQGIPDQGIHRNCNQYCADHNECQSGLVCYYNACRNPNNVTSETCTTAAPTNTPKPINGGIKVTTKPQPTPTATLVPKGGIFDNNDSLPTQTPDVVDTNIQKFVSPIPQSTTNSILNTTQSDPLEEFPENAKLATSPFDTLTSLPSYIWYGIITLVVFFIALLIYTIHTWKQPRKLKKSSKQPQSYNMSNFAGNMEAHVKKDE